MDTSYADLMDAAGDQHIFRSLIARFLCEKLPLRLAQTPRVGLVMPLPMQLEWQSILYNHGLAAPGWPRKFGGRDWALSQMHMWYDECAKARAPRHVLQSLSMIGPIIMQFGSVEQHARHLPGILSGQVMWCQGYSEPGSGSDLISLRTQAVRSGDHYIVNGQKIWTTFAHESDWIFALVRTDSSVAPSRGISFLLIDMRSPGLVVKPIISIDGLHHLNEVFFTDVVVPAENLIGAENEGWRYAKALLNHERLSICDPTELKARAAMLKRFCALPEGRLHLDASLADLQRKLAVLDISLIALDASYQRVRSDIEAGRDPGQAAAALKFMDTELSQSLHEIDVEITGLMACGDQTAAFRPSDDFESIGPAALSLAFAGYAFSRAYSIAGGTSEVQKNIIWRGLAS